MKYALFVLIIFSSCVNSKMVSNAKAVETYEKQLEQTKRMMDEVKQTLIASDAIITMYKNLGYTTPEVKAVSRHLIILGEDIQSFYGDVSLNPTPFSACAHVPSNAYNFWLERLNSVSRNNENMIKIAAQRYIDQANDCVHAINTPPKKEIEQSEELQIIDVSP